MNSGLKTQSHSLMNEFLCAFRRVRALSLGPLSVKTDRVIFLVVCVFCLFGFGVGFFCLFLFCF